MEYQKLYNEFLSSFKQGTVSGEAVGEIIVRMASHYADLNIAMVIAENKLSLVAKDIEMKTDDISGKPISSTKAKVIADATPECHAFNIARAHLQNAEMFVQSLKSLQKGILNEYTHSSLA